MRNLLNKIANPFMKVILRSPFHGLLSHSTMLINFIGRKSGKTYTIPVNYVRDGDTLVVLSRVNRTWWKNLRGGAPITVRVQGQDLRGAGVVFEDPKSVSQSLLTLLQKVPTLRRHYPIRLTTNGQPENPEAFREMTQDKVIVRVTDLKPTGYQKTPTR